MSGTSNNVSRRSFIASAGVGAGAAASSLANESAAPEAVADPQPPPREVWIGSVCQDGLSARTPDEMIAKMLRRMEEMVPMQPDVICLPECFHVVQLDGPRPAAAAACEEPIGPYSRPFAEFARRHHCHVICPIYTRDSGNVYNSAVVIDRAGEYVGEYRKINPTESELRGGITPGTLDPPVFKLDFGTIGIQICFDVNWHQNWSKLAAKGAEIVFWPSAFAGGQMLNGMAWINKFYVVSSTRIQATKVVDVLGEDVVSTGRFGKWVCAPINLDVAVVQGYQYMRKLDRARAKYGRKINVRTKHVEAWAAVESLSADVSVPQLLAEFGVETSHEMLARNTRIQDARR